MTASGRTEAVAIRLSSAMKRPSLDSDVWLKLDAFRPCALFGLG